MYEIFIANNKTEKVLRRAITERNDVKDKLK